MRCYRKVDPAYQARYGTAARNYICRGSYRFGIYPRDDQSKSIWTDSGHQTVFHIELNGPEKRTIWATQQSGRMNNQSSDATFVDLYSFGVLVSIPGSYALSVGVREYKIETQTCHAIFPCVHDPKGVQLSGAPFHLRFSAKTDGKTAPSAFQVHRLNSTLNGVQPDQLPPCQNMEDAFAGSFISKGSISDAAFEELDRYIRSYHNKEFARGESEMVSWQPFQCRVRFLSPAVCHSVPT